MYYGHAFMKSRTMFLILFLLTIRCIINTRWLSIVVLQTYLLFFIGLQVSVIIDEVIQKRRLIRLINCKITLLEFILSDFLEQILEHQLLSINLLNYDVGLDAQLLIIVAFTSLQLSNLLIHRLWLCNLAAILPIIAENVGIGTRSYEPPHDFRWQFFLDCIS